MVERKGRNVGDEALLKEAFHFHLHLFWPCRRRKVVPAVPRYSNELSELCQTHVRENMESGEWEVCC